MESNHETSNEEITTKIPSNGDEDSRSKETPRNSRQESENVTEEKLLAELFHVLSAQRLTPDGEFQVGVRHGSLKKALNMDDDELDELLDRLARQIDPLGLDLVEYELEAERWFAIRSRLPAPVPLNEEQYTVLAAIIYHIEQADKRVSSKTIIDFLNRKNYIKPSKTREIIRELSQLGYVKRLGKHGNFLTYGPRTILEFSRADIEEIIDKLSALFL